MLRLFFIETKNCIRRLEFQLGLIVALIISIGAYLINAYIYYGDTLYHLRSAFELSIIQGICSKFLLQLLVIVLPLLSSIIYSDTYYIDYKTGVYKHILTKAKKRDYYLAKGLVNFFIVFLVFFIPLLINQVLCLIAFPTEGSFNNLGVPYYDVGYTNYNPDFILDLLSIKNPLIYNLTYMIIISTFAAIFSLLIYSIQLYYKKNRFTIPLITFIIYLIISILGEISGLNSISVLKLMQPNVIGEFWAIPIIQALLLIISVFLILNKSKKEIDL